MNSWTKSIFAWALIAMPALGATVTIEEILKVSAGSVFPATSTPVPGRAANIVFRGDNPIPPPSINDAGQVVFRARSAFNTNTNTNTAFGIYAKSPSSAMIVLADTTEVSPGIPTFAVPGRPANNRFANFQSPLINNAGDVVFHATFSSPGTAPSSGQGIYATKVTGGPIVRIVDTFTAVPAYPTALFNNFLPGLLGVESTIVLNDAGQVAYRGQFLVPGNATQRFGIFGSSVSGAAGVRLADSVGASGPVSVPIGSNGFFNDIRFAIAMNNAGTVAFSAGMPGGATNRGGVYVVPVTGGAIETVAIRGQAVPGRPGNTFQDTFEPGGHNLDINDSGIVIFRNQYQLSSPLDTGAYSAAPGIAGYVHTRIYDTGPGLSVPGEPAGAEFSGFVLPGVNEAGVVSPFSFVSPGSPTPNQQGIYYTDLDGSPNSVVANLDTAPPGQPAPVGGFPRFTSFIQSNGALGVLNENGNLTFLGIGNPTSGTGFRGVYFYDVCTPELVRISDSTISLSQLGAVVNNAYDIWQVESHAGMYRPINDANDVAFAAQFTNFDYGLYVAHITGGGGGQLNVTCPPDTVVECPGSVDPSITGEATATGCGTITVSHSDVTTAGCGATSSISRTWTASNGSTTASCVQSISVVDSVDPALAGVPSDANVQCDGFPLPAAPAVTASDACQGSVDVSLSETQMAGACPGTYVLTRTWTATDGCGNSVSASQDVAVMDNVDPVLVGVPGDVSVECDAVPLVAEVAASDTCDTSIPVSFVESTVSGDCPDTYTLTRSWTAADDCGNDVTAMQLVSVDDTMPPSIACPPHASLECPADTSVGANGSASGVDNCGIVTIGMSESSVAGCGQTQTITRSWSASDECGNSASCDQLVSVVDTTPPTITVDGSPITAADTDCSGSEAVTLPTATASDACDGAVTVNNNAPPSFPGGTTTVTYSASDACGNGATADLSVNVLFGANIHVEVASHQVGSGTHPGSTKTPLANLTVCAYDKSEGSCPRTVCGGISHQHYQCILDDCSPVNCCITDSNGECTINLPPGDYIVVSGEATKTVLPDPLGVSASDLACGQTMQKHLQQIVKVDGKKTPAKTTRLTGSELLIIEPEYVIWDDTVQYYPFVFETIGDWSVTATVAPPEGFVADYPALTAEVDNELEAVQFRIEEVGSDLVPTVTTFDVLHNGKRKEVRSAVDILLTPDYAKSRGFNVDELRTKGIIVEPKRNEKAMQRSAGTANR